MPNAHFNAFYKAHFSVTLLNLHLNALPRAEVQPNIVRIAGKRNVLADIRVVTVNWHSISCAVKYERNEPFENPLRSAHTVPIQMYLLC